MKNRKRDKEIKKKHGIKSDQYLYLFNFKTFSSLWGPFYVINMVIYKIKNYDKNTFMSI